jgi:hypothetical protein
MRMTVGEKCGGCELFKSFVTDTAAAIDAGEVDGKVSYEDLSVFDDCANPTYDALQFKGRCFTSVLFGVQASLNEADIPEEEPESERE